MTALSIASLREAARRAGFEFSDAELESIRPDVERALAGLARLEGLASAAADPLVQFRVL